MRKRERRKIKLNINHTESMSHIKRKASLKKKKKGLFFKLTECYQTGTNIRLRVLWGRTGMGEREWKDGTIGGG